MVNIGKEKNAGSKKMKSTQKRKYPANQKQVEFKRVLIPCDEHYDMIAKPTLPKPALNQHQRIFCLCLKSATETCPSATIVAIL